MGVLAGVENELDIEWGDVDVKYASYHPEVIVADYRLDLDTESSSFVAPNFTDEQEGQALPLTLEGHNGNEALPVANSRTVILLTATSDYDSDGLSNLLEHQLGYHPLLQDSDGNGVADGQEDYDNDGLNNATEVALGADLREQDSDDDGVADGVEYQWGTDLLSADSDNDGIDDAVEIASGSDPTDSHSRAINPELVTAIQVTPKELTYNINFQNEDVRLTVVAQLMLDGRTYSADVSDAGFYDLVFSSSDESVAIPSYQGFTPVAKGEAMLTVTLGAHSDTSRLVVSEVPALGACRMG